MMTWLQKIKESNKETRLFVFTVILYTAAVILPTFYCYLRLDYVRSYDTTTKAVEVKANNK